MHPFENLVVQEGEVGIHWFGQSTYGLKDCRGTIVQVDPYYPHERPADKFIRGRPPLHEEALQTDFILLTHDHGDHTCIESIGRILGAYQDVHCIGPSESAERVRSTGMPHAQITTVTAGDCVNMGAMEVNVVLAKPPDGDPANGIEPPDVEHLGYVIVAGRVRVYISGDPINTFADHPSLLDPIRQLKPDIGLLTNHPKEGEFPFFDGSSKMAVELELKAAVPAHYGCFVQRDYDPAEWASNLPSDGPAPLIIAYNQSIIYRPT